MMTFQDRERAFEAKYVHDEDLRFRVAARRDKLFAQQAAGRLGLSEQAAAALVTAVLAVRDGPGHDGLLIRYMTDVFSEHGRAEAADGLSASLDACDKLARQQLLAQPDSQ
jgi:hypothetical protein